MSSWTTLQRVFRRTLGRRSEPEIRIGQKQARCQKTDTEDRKQKLLDRRHPVSPELRHNMTHGRGESSEGEKQIGETVIGF
jgi:hypothetical protein